MVARKERDKTQRAAAKELGISYQTLSYIERGHVAPGHEWERIASHYSLDARELLERAARIPEPEEGNK